MEETIGEIQFLTASNARAKLLRTLGVDGRLSKDDLYRRVDASRTTIGRHLDALEERGYIAHDPATNEYEATARGTAVARELSSVLETTSIADQLTRLLQWIPDKDLDFELRHLADAKFVFSERHDPYAPVNHHVETVQKASRFRCLLPSTGRSQMHRMRESRAREEEYAIVVERDILETMLSDERYERELLKMEESERFEISAYDGDIPYFLGIYDDAIHVGVEDDKGMLQALLESESPPIREWGEKTYESYRRRSTPLD